MCQVYCINNTKQTYTGRFGYIDQFSAQKNKADPPFGRPAVNSNQIIQEGKEKMKKAIIVGRGRTCPTR